VIANLVPEGEESGTLGGIRHGVGDLDQDPVGRDESMAQPGGLLHSLLVGRIALVEEGEEREGIGETRDHRLGVP
jgi:hypothetical protein